MESHNRTKDKIIEAAFKVLLEVPFTRISLSDVASHVGITKPAIYRHFSSKENLFDVMRESLFDQFAIALKAINPQASPLEFSTKALDFFVQRPGYLNFFMMSMMSEHHSADELSAELAKRDIVIETSFITNGSDFLLSCGDTVFHFPVKSSCTDNCYIFLRQIFFTATGTFCTMFLQRYALQEKKELPHDLSSRLATLISYGWSALEPIPAERFSQLDRIAAIHSSELPVFDRFPVAIANVVKKYGFPGTTIERIADELGLAKSSFYSHFKSKTQFLSEFLTNEFLSIFEFVRKRMSNANNLSEAVYIYLSSIASYVMVRSEILPVFGWLRNSGYVIHNRIMEQSFNTPFFSQFSNFEFPDMGVGTSDLLLFMWMHSIEISTVIQFREHGFSDIQIMESVPTLYGFMQHGLCQECGSDMSDGTPCKEI